MNLKRSILKFWVVRFLYVATRYFFLKNLLKISYRYNPKAKIDNLVGSSKDTAIQHNTNYFNWSILTKYKEFFLPEFLGLRSNRLVNPLIELPFINRNINKLKILSVGPRDEGEIYNLFTKGFEFENIFAIDLFSYSKKIKVGDVHNLDYPENFFDIILSSYTLTYSTDQKLFISNLVRCAKNGGIIAIAVGNYFNNERDMKSDYKNYDEFLNLFKEYIDRIYFRTYSEDYLNNENHHHYYLIFKVKK